MRKKGFTLVEIMIVVAIIGLLAAIAIPNFMKSRVASQATTCVNNLRQIYHAKEQWASQVGAAPGAAVQSVVNDRNAVIGFLAGGEPSCPVRNSYAYEFTIVGEHPLCHYSQLGWNDSEVWHALRKNPRDVGAGDPAWLRDASGFDDDEQNWYAPHMEDPDEPGDWILADWITGAGVAEDYPAGLDD